MTDTVKATIASLTSIRGFAALWVYLYHQRDPLNDGPIFSAIANRGYFGVDMFFILSGFIISHAHADEFDSRDGLRNNSRRFLLLRLCRIYPMHLIMLLLFFLIGPVNEFEVPGKNWTDALANLALVQAWAPVSAFYWNIPSWSISVEWLLYLLFPLIICVVGERRKSLGANLALFVSVMLGWAAFIYLSQSPIDMMERPGITVPRGVLDFTLGIALYNLYRLDFMKALDWDAAVVGLLLCFFLYFWFQSTGFVHAELPGIFLMALLIYALANVKSFAQAFFSNRAAVYLGTISYSFYIIHWFYLLITWQYRASLFPHPGETFQFIARLLMLVGLASLSYHLVENPARKWTRQRLNRTK